MLRKGSLAICLLVLGACPAHAIDLTTQGATATIQSVIFTEGNAFPSASDIHQPFLRFQATGTEQGFNTDFRPLEPDAVGLPTVTHSVRLSSMARRRIETSTTTDYYVELWIDANESTLSGERYLSIDQLRIYASDNPSIPTAANLAAAALLYDMDLPSDQVLLLDSILEPGSGVPTVTIDVPTSYFAGVADSSYIYVFVRAGVTGLVGARQYGSSGGFEEVSALAWSNPSAVPVSETTAGPTIWVAGGLSPEGLRFRCSAPNAGRAAIRLFDARGRALARFERETAAGSFDVPLSAFRDAPAPASGIYFYRFEWNGVTRAVGKVTILR